MTATAPLKLTDPALHGCHFRDRRSRAPDGHRAFAQSPLMNIPNGLQLCGPALSLLIQRHTLLLAGTFDRWTPDMTDVDVWAICDSLMAHEGYETLAHFMPTNCASAVKERVAQEAAGDPQAKGEWQARLDLARSGAASTSEISARMMAASALSIGYEADYFEREPIWMRRAYQPGDQRDWETHRRDGTFSWTLPAGVMSRVMAQVESEMRERGMLAADAEDLRPQLAWLERG